SARRPVAGHQGQHLADRLRADLAGPTAEVQGRSLGAVRRDPERRRRRLEPVSNSTTGKAPCNTVAGGLFMSIPLSLDQKGRLTVQTAYTSADHALGISLAPSHKKPQRPFPWARKNKELHACRC